MTRLVTDFHDDYLADRHPDSRFVRMGNLWHWAIARTFIDSSWVHLWQCHRLSERSFFSRGRQLHLCARCTGLSIGAAFSLVLAPFLSLDVEWVIAGVGAIAVDGVTQLAGLRSSNNGLRLATGVVAGSVLGIAAFHILGSAL